MNPSPNAVVTHFLQRFQESKRTAEAAVIQVPDPLLHQALDENTNSLAVIMKHMAGNLRSRFTDFLTSDGEKPDRDRDSEFVDDLADRHALMVFWEQGWQCLFHALTTLQDADLQRAITIRGQPHTVLDALLRALSHQSYHTGQIVQLARHLARDQWKTLTIPRGGSRQFNERMEQKFGK